MLNVQDSYICLNNKASRGPHFSLAWFFFGFWDVYLGDSSSSILCPERFLLPYRIQLYSRDTILLKKKKPNGSFLLCERIVEQTFEHKKIVSIVEIMQHPFSCLFLLFPIPLNYPQQLYVQLPNC